MIEHGVYIRWEHTLIGIVHLDGRIGPPKEGLRQIRTVTNSTLNLEIGAARTQRKARHTLLVEHPLHLVHPDGHRVVFILHNGTVDRHKGTGTVVLRPVELDATRDPRSCKTHQCRFDDVVIIDEMALFDLVVSHLDASAQLRQDHHLDILVLDINGLIFLVDLLVADRLNHRVRINHTT